MIRLRDDIVFENPESRIREYCAVEIYQGYDDKHNINDHISQGDIDAANRLYAMINRYDKTESRRLLQHDKIISNFLASIPNKDLFAFPETEWDSLKENIRELLAQFLSIRGIALAKATKILHLKRPRVFPVLDRFVIRFLLGVDVSNVEKDRQLDVGINAFEKVRETIADQKSEFTKLAEQTSDLPIPLTPVRMFDILCWTAEKWDIVGNLNAPYGVPYKSLLYLQKLKMKQYRKSAGAQEKAMLRPFQRDAVRKIEKAREAKGRVLLSLSQGSGRSLIIIHAVSDLLKTGKIRRALLVAPNKELLNFYFDRLSEKPWQISPIQLSRLTSHTRRYLEREFKEAAVFLSSINTFKKDVARFPPDFFDIILLDECQLLLDEDWEIVRNFDSTIVGLTSLHPIQTTKPLNSLGLRKPTYSYGITSLKLKEIAEILLGANYSSSDLFKKGNWKFIRPRDVRNNRILKVKTYTSDTFAKKNIRSSLIAGDILLQNVFDFSKIAVVEQKHLPALASRNFFIIRPKKVSSEFLLDYLQSETIRIVFQEQLEDLAHGFIKHVNLKDVKEIDIPIPYSEKDMEGFLVAQKQRGKRTSIQDLERIRDGIKQLRLIYQRQKDLGD